MSANPSDVSRRAFLKAGATLTGGLVIAISMPGCKPATKASGELKTFEANAWLHIGSDDKITFFCDKSEMGQGVYTALPMLIAEELGVGLERIKVEFAPPGDMYINNLIGGQITGGSTSVRDGWEKLRKAGVIFQPLERAMIEHEDLFRQHFMSQPATLGSAKFAALHEAYVRSGTFLYVPAGVEVELPLETFHWLHGENTAIFPHTLVVAEKLSKVTLIDYFRSTDRQRPGFACGVNDLIVRAGAKVTYICAQDWSDRTLSIQINATTVARDFR